MLQSPYAKKKPEACSRCGTSLKFTIHVYKGKDSERHYCGIDCCAKGEEWHLRRKLDEKRIHSWNGA